MTTGLDAVLGQVDPARMTATVARLAGDDFAGPSRRWTPRIGAGMGGCHSPADTADRVDPATLAAVCRLVVATACLASGKLSSLIGDRR